MLGIVQHAAGSMQSRRSETFADSIGGSRQKLSLHLAIFVGEDRLLHLPACAEAADATTPKRRMLGLPVAE